MNIYNYDENTKEYLSTVEADSDPVETELQGKFVPLIPANATLKEIPSYNQDNQIPVFEDNNWVVKSDYRKNYYKVDENLNISNIYVIGEQEGIIVDKATGNDIKQNQDWYKIVDNEVVKKSDEEYNQEQRIKAQQTKYAEITEKYDYANKYLILKVDDEQELYANVAWYQTWSKVMSLAQQIAPQSETTTIPSPVRFYKLTPDGKLYNKSVAGLDVAKLLEYFNKVQFAQFNVLQPKRDILYLQLAQAKTIEDIEAIDVEFGITLNEQDMADVTAKVDLTYVEPTEEQPVEEVTDLVEVEDEETVSDD